MSVLRVLFVLSRNILADRAELVTEKGYDRAVELLVDRTSARRPRLCGSIRFRMTGTRIQ